MKSGGETFRETVLSEKAKKGEEDSFRAPGDSDSCEQTGWRSEQTSETQRRRVKGNPRRCHGRRQEKDRFRNGSLATWVDGHIKDERLKQSQCLATWRPVP